MEPNQSGSERRLPIWAIALICLATVGLGTVVACRLLPPAASQPAWWTRLGWLVLAGEAVVYGMAAVLIGARRLSALGGAILAGLVARGLMAAIGLAVFTPGAASPAGIQQGIRDMLVGDMTRTVVEVLFVIIGVLLSIKPYIAARKVRDRMAPPAEPAAQPAATQAPPTDLATAYPGLSSAPAEPIRGQAPLLPPPVEEEGVEAPAEQEREVEAPPPGPVVAPSADEAAALDEAVAPTEAPVTAEAPAEPVIAPPGPVSLGLEEAPPTQVEPPEQVEAVAPELAEPAEPDVEEALGRPEAAVEPEPTADSAAGPVPTPRAEEGVEPPIEEERVFGGLIAEAEEEPLAPEAESVAEHAAEETLQVATEPEPPEPPATGVAEEADDRAAGLADEEKEKLEELVDQLMASARGPTEEEPIEVVEQPRVEEPEPAVEPGPLFSFEIEGERPAEEEAQAPTPSVEAARAEPEPGEPVFRISGEGLAPAEEPSVPVAPTRPAQEAPSRPAAEVEVSEVSEEPRAAELPPDAASTVVRVSAEAILPQFPDGALTIAPDEVESVFTDKKFEIPLDLIVHQLKEGEVRVPPRAIIPQMPPGSVAASDVELDAALADGIELPLGEIVPQIPPSLLTVSAAETTAPEVPEEDIFEVPDVPDFDARVTARRPSPTPTESEPALAEPQPAAAEERADWDSLLAGVSEEREGAPTPPTSVGPAPDVVRVSAEAVLSQIPPAAFTTSAEQVIASMDSPVLEFSASEVLRQLDGGQVVFSSATVAAQLPAGTFQHSPEEMDAAMPAGGIELPLAEVVQQLGPEALAVTEQAPPPEVGDEVLFDEEGIHPLTERVAPAARAPTAAPSRPGPVAPQPAPPAPAPESVPAPVVEQPAMARLDADDAVRGALLPIVQPLGVLTPCAVASPSGPMACALPEGLAPDAPAAAGAALLQSAEGLCKGSGYGDISTVLLSATGGSATIAVATAASGQRIACQIVARGVDNVGKVAMASHKALAALKDIPMEAPASAPAEAERGRAVAADADGFDLQAAAGVAGAGLSVRLFECQSVPRLAAFGPEEAVAPDVAAWADAVLRDTRAYLQASGLGELSKVMLEGTNGVAALAAPRQADLPCVLLMPAKAVKLGLISVQVGKVAAALTSAGSA